MNRYSKKTLKYVKDVKKKMLWKELWKTTIIHCEKNVYCHNFLKMFVDFKMKWIQAWLTQWLLVLVKYLQTLSVKNKKKSDCVWKIAYKQLCCANISFIAKIAADIKINSSMIHSIHDFMRGFLLKIIIWIHFTELK